MVFVGTGRKGARMALLSQRPPGLAPARGRRGAPLRYKLQILEVVGHSRFDRNNSFFYTDNLWYSLPSTLFPPLEIFLPLNVGCIGTLEALTEFFNFILY